MSSNIQPSYSVPQNSLAFKAKSPIIPSVKKFNISSKKQLMKTMNNEYPHYLSRAKLNQYMSIWKQREKELSPDDFRALADKVRDFYKEKTPSNIPNKIKEVPHFFDQLIKLIK